MTDSIACCWITAIFLTLLVAPTAYGFEVNDEERLLEAIDAFAHEPDISQVQQQVLDHRELDNERPDRWTRRARLSSLIPTIQGQASWLDQRDQQNQFRENITADEEGQYERNYAQHNLDDDLRLRAIYSLRLNFDLSGLLYNNSEMAIQREVRNRWSMRDDLVNEVTDLYFARRRQQLYLHLFPDEDLEETLERHIEIQALTARIDTLTGGWFRRQLEEE